MTEDERFAWLQLAFTPYIGAESFLLLLRRFGSASNALSAPPGRPVPPVRTGR
ncbi:DNA-protecting protein DprA, partial [Neisseria meningitidis]|nr:DNA-protecting protein DprA [Neisseria meningitidis]